MSTALSDPSYMSLGLHTLPRGGCLSRRFGLKFLHSYRSTCKPNLPSPRFCIKMICLLTPKLQLWSCFSKNAQWYGAGLHVWILLGLLMYLSALRAYAQLQPVGTWRTYPAYQEAQLISGTPTFVYVASQNGLFRYDRQEQSLEPLSNLLALSDNRFTLLQATGQASEDLLIGYVNGAIDLWQQNRLYALSALAQAELTGSKQLYQAAVDGQTAYLASEAGVVILDLRRRQVREIYRNLGINASVLPTRGIALWQDSLFIATPQGVQRAALRSNLNLQDFSVWQRSAAGSLPLPVGQLAVWQDTLYAATPQGIWRYARGQWQQRWPWPTQRLHSRNGQLIALTANGVYRIQLGQAPVLVQATNITTPQDAWLDDQGQLWLADATRGLLVPQGQTWQARSPNGPARQAAFRLRQGADSVWVLNGGFGNNGQALNRPANIALYAQGQWRNLNAAQGNFLPSTQDPADAVYLSNSRTWWLGTMGDGLLRRSPDGQWVRLTNSGLPQANGQINVTALAATSQGELWVQALNPQGGATLFRFPTDNGSPQAYFAPNNALRQASDVFVSRNGLVYVWNRQSPEGGLWVLDPRTNDSRVLNAFPGTGELPSAQVLSLAQDLEGQLWIGTSNGVAVIASERNVFVPDFRVIRPVFDSRPLLRFESVLAIAVDGGNRKWMGTRNGLWAFNPAGTALEARFDTQNSPLRSDTITSLAWQGRSGELIVATPQGLWGYRTDASAAPVTVSTLHIFPNPVRSDFSGLVAIEGFARNSEVRITDIAGRLVYRTQAQGGTATWPLTDAQGRRPPAGVYLVFGSLPDGQEALVGKIAITGD